MSTVPTISDPEDKLGAMILERLTDRHREYATKHKEWTRNEEKKKGLIKTPYPYRNRLSNKYIKSTLGTLSPQYVGALIGDVGSDFFDMVPEEKTDEKLVSLIKQLMIKQMENIRILVAKLNSWSMANLTYGVGYVGVFWKIKKLNVRKFVKREISFAERIMANLSGKQLEQFQKVAAQEIVYRGPDMKNWSNFNFYEADLSLLDLQEQPYIFANFITTLQRLEQLQKNSPKGKIVGLDVVKDKGPFEGDDEEDSKNRLQQDDHGIEKNTAPYQDKGLFPVKVIGYYSSEEDRMVLITHSGVSILRGKTGDDGKKENAGVMPYDHGMYPFSKMVNRAEEGNALGESEIDLIADLSDALDLSMNARQDWMSTQAHPMLLLENGAGFKLKDVTRSEPGKTIRGNDIGALKFLESRVDLSGLIDEDRFKESIKELTGTPDPIRGITKAGTKETATLGTIKTNSALDRFKIQVRINESMGLKDFLSLSWKLNMQFMTTEQAIRIAGAKGQEWKEIPRDGFVANYDFKLLAGSEAFHTELEKNRLLEMMTIVQGDPTINQKAFKTRLFRLAKIPNPEELLNNPNLRDPQTENIMLLQGQAVLANPEDLHQSHIPSHMAILNSPLVSRMNPGVRQFFEDHLNQHIIFQTQANSTLGVGGAPPASIGAPRGDSTGSFIDQGTGTRGPGLAAPQSLAGNGNA